MITIEEVVVAVAASPETNLNAWGPSSIGANVVDRVVRPRRWVWVPTTETSAAAEKRDGSLSTSLAVVEVHMWGLTEGECRAMQAALVLAVRIVLGGRRYSRGTSRWVERQDAHRGVALVCPLTLELPMPRVELPLTSASIEDFAHTTVVVETTQITPEVED